MPKVWMESETMTKHWDSLNRKQVISLRLTKEEFEALKEKTDELSKKIGVKITHSQYIRNKILESGK